MATTVDRQHDQPRPARDHCLAPARSLDAPQTDHRYTRMFPDLSHLSMDATLLHAIGRAGGACDTANSARQEARPVAAGWPVFGQYVAHDITADRSPVSHHDDEAGVANNPSARPHPGCPFAQGPGGDPLLFNPNNP